MQDWPLAMSEHTSGSHPQALAPTAPDTTTTLNPTKCGYGHAVPRTRTPKTKSHPSLQELPGPDPPTYIQRAPWPPPRPSNDLPRRAPHVDVAPAMASAERRAGRCSLLPSRISSDADQRRPGGAQGPPRPVGDDARRPGAPPFPRRIAVNAASFRLERTNPTPKANKPVLIQRALR
jgi:hypothetical protein